MMRTLFLNPPSCEEGDGEVRLRYPVRREIRSFGYPTWLAQAAALVPGSRLLDAPARGLKLDDLLLLAIAYDLLIIHTSTLSFGLNVKVAEAFKARNPRLLIGLVGAHAAVLPEPSLAASPAIDFVAGSEFDHTIMEVAEGAPLERIAGLSYRREGRVVHNPPRPLIEDLDQLPPVAEVYHRDLTIEDYFIGYLLHPYVALYTGRGCKSRCSFCLWPQTIAGHRYRTRSPQSVASEVALVKEYFPQVREVFFDDGAFMDDGPRAEAIARLLGKMGVIWSCNAKANVSYPTLRLLRENGLRLLLVGYESGSQTILNNIKKGTSVEVARRFAADCRSLGITIHGTFIIGLPGETSRTIEETIRFAREVNPHTIQVSLAAAYPGTALYRQAQENHWLRVGDPGLVSGPGLQVSSLAYPDLSHEQIFEAVGRFYRRFYLRPNKIFELSAEMARRPRWIGRRLREGVEFFQLLASRKNAG